MAIKEKAKDVKQVFEGDKSVNRTYTSYNTFLDDKEAIEAFELAKARMYKVNAWGKIPGPENADFILFDENGIQSDKLKPKVDYYIKTILPGGLPENWVRIIDVQEDPDSASFTVRPSKNPTEEAQHPAETVHFFKSSATSTFKLEREGNRLKAMEMGINESINNQGPEAGDRKMINTMVAEAGWALIQEKQWKNVTDYIVGLISLKEDRS